MQRHALLFFLLLIVVLGASAVAQQQPASGSDLAAPAFTFATPETSKTPAQQPRVFSSPEWLPGLSVDGKATTARRNRAPYDRGVYLGAEQQCFTMRSYLVRREARDSDVTTPAGYTTCTPSTKVQMKSTKPEE